MIWWTKMQARVQFRVQLKDSICFKRVQIGSNKFGPWTSIKSWPTKSNLATFHFIEENRKTYKDVEKLEFIPPRDLPKSSYKQDINHMKNKYLKLSRLYFFGYILKIKYTKSDDFY
jgi:hypothetical protein